MTGEQQSGGGAATAAQPASILRSRSARLADQAATAALYVTHPDRRLSVREPAMADTQLFRDSTATGGRLDLSHASAGAALAHAQSKPLEVWRPTAQPAAEKAAFHARDYRAPDALYVAQPTPEGHCAASSAIKDRRSVTGLSPTSTGLKLDPEPGQTANLQRRASEREKALRAAAGAYNVSRRRAGTVPGKQVSVSQPLAASAAGASNEVPDPGEAPLEHLDSAMEASRIQHMANPDAQLYTSSPHNALDREEQKRRNVQRAAVVSMARDTYDTTETKGEEQAGAAVYAAQRGLSQMGSQRQRPKTDPKALQQAISLQDAAHKRAQEKLAMMHDETAAFQEYYGTAPQPARTLTSRKRRTSVDTDVERSDEIRKQMSSLRTKVGAVDEQREKDRSFLLEAARKNVDATIHDMEMRVYAETGRAPPSVQKDWEEVAEEHVKQEQQEAQPQYPDRVHIGAEHYINMADVEALARSRVQPTLDGINEHAEELQAKETEQRLDEERKKRLQAVEHEREADLKAEEKRMKDALKHPKEEKPEKSKRWSKKSKESREEPSAEKAETTGAVGAGAAAPPAEAPPAEAPSAEAPSAEAPSAEAPSAEAPSAEAPPGEDSSSRENLPEMYRSQTAEGENGVVILGGAAEPADPAKAPPSKPESKFRNWFMGRRRTSHQSGEAAAKPAKEPAQKETNRTDSSAEAVVRRDSRGAALGSHPITGDELVDMQRRRSSLASATEEGPQSAAKEKGNGEGKRPSRLRSSFMKMTSRNKESKANDHEGGTQVAERSGAQGTSTTAEREGLRDSAAEQGLPVPPAIGKQVSNGTGAGNRESRFSEDL